jgi:hypothetical protein
LLYDSIGWRSLLIIGVLPALLVVYIRRYVKEPEVWVKNRGCRIDIDRRWAMILPAL